MSVPEYYMARPRLLLVDDNRAILDCVRNLIAGEFDVVGMVTDGQAAVHAAAQLNPDLIVCDISMPVMNGIEAARRIRSVPDPPRVVFLTVHEDEAFLEAARQVGASGYVLKHRMGTDLVGAIRRALEGGADQPSHPENATTSSRI